MLYRVGNALVRFVARVFLGLKVSGAENEPKDGSLIVCANHISFLDPVLICAFLKRRVKFMAKSELFKNKLFNKIILCYGAIPVKRGMNDLGAIRQAMQLLKNGGVLGIFPFGRRVREGQAEEESQAKTGIAMLAARTQSAVLPVRVLTKRGRVGLWCGYRIVVGEPIAYEDLGFVTGGHEEYGPVSDRIMEQVMSLS